MNNDNNLQNNNGVQNSTPVTNEVQVGVPSQSSSSTMTNVPGPAPAETIPGPAQSEEIPAIPASGTEQVVLDTAPKKSGSNILLFIVVILLILAVVYIDEVIVFIEENIMTTNPTDVDDSDGDNLVGGFILLNDTTGSIKVNSIKFYNFKKNNDNFTIILNYESGVQFKDIASENMYIEFYNANKEVLHKSLFTLDGEVEKNAVRTYSVQVESEVFQNSMFALVKKYSNDELSKSSSLSCKYMMSNEGYNEIYKHDFIFKNDMLVSYTVNKKVDVSTQGVAATRALTELKEENDKVVLAGLSTNYSEGNLVYTIDVANLNVEFIPLYSKGTTSTSVKNKEVFKKWVCE